MEEQEIHPESMQVDQADAVRAKSVRRGRFEIALLFILGILLGIAVKTEAYERITIGFQDYTLTQQDLKAYDINALQKDLIAKGDSLVDSSGSLGGGACGVGQ